MALQVLIKTPKDAAVALDVAGRTLHTAHAQLEAILQSRLGRNHGDLLAVPRVQADGSIQWCSALAGAVASAAQLPDDERRTLERRAERLRSDVAGLAQQLQGEGAASQVVAQMLHGALRTPPGQWLFSVGGKPVLAMWGHADAASSAPPAAAPATVPVAPGVGPAAGVAPVAAPVAGDAGDAGNPPPAAPAPPPPGGPRKPWWRWLAWALLVLLLLALLLWGLRRCAEAPKTDDADLEAKIAAAQARNAELEDELRRKRAAQMMCVPDAPLPAASAPEPLPPPQEPASAPPPEAPPAPPPPAPSAPASAPPPKPPPSAPPPRPAASTPRPAPPAAPPRAEAPAASAPASPSAAGPQRTACKPRSPGDEPEVVMIVDASGSMNKPFGSAPSRIDAAKRAAASMIRGLPEDVDVALVDFAACGQVRRDRFYKGSERGALIGEIDRLAPKQGTPLADALKRAGTVASDSADSVLVVISDGGDSCGGDPCAVARSIKAAKPNVTINVIDLSESPQEKAALQCIARAGGGRVLSPGDPVDMNRKMKEAAGAANCPG